MNWLPSDVNALKVGGYFVERFDTHPVVKLEPMNLIFLEIILHYGVDLF